MSKADLRDAEPGWVDLDLDYQHAAANLAFAQMEKTDFLSSRVTAYRVMGFAYTLQREPTRAREAYTEALALSRPLVSAHTCPALD